MCTHEGYRRRRRAPGVQWTHTSDVTYKDINQSDGRKSRIRLRCSPGETVWSSFDSFKANSCALPSGVRQFQTYTAVYVRVQTARHVMCGQSFGDCRLFRDKFLANSRELRARESSRNNIALYRGCPIQRDRSVIARRETRTL